MSCTCLAFRVCGAVMRIVLCLAALTGFAAADDLMGHAAVFRSDALVWRFDKPVPQSAAHGSDDLPGQSRGWIFDPNVRVHPEESGQHIWPDIAVAEDGTIGVAWMDDHAAGGYHIFYAYSGDAGATWSAAERIDDRTAGSYSKFVSIAFTPMGKAVAVWEDDRSGQYNLYFSKREALLGFPPWSANQRINTAGSPPTGSDFMNGSLTILDDLRYFVAWTDWREGVFNQVYMRGTWDGGVSWSLEHRVSDGLGYEPVAGDPCLIVDPNFGGPGDEILYCVTNDWRGYAPQGRFPNVYFYRSVDGGSTWSIGVQVNDIEPLFQQTSSHGMVRLADGSLAAGWLNNPDWTLNHYRVSRSMDDGATWGASLQVDEATAGGTGTYSSIATDGEWLYAGFDVYSTSWDVYFRASPDGGEHWPDASMRMDDDATGAASGDCVIAAPLLAHVPGGYSREVYAAWQDTRAPGNNWKIYATKGALEATGLPETARVGPNAACGWRLTPNPSRVGTVVTAISGIADWRAGSHDVGIHDASGRLVSIPTVEGNRVIWQGDDLDGRQVPPGCYWLRARGERAAPGARLVRTR